MFKFINSATSSVLKNRTVVTSAKVVGAVAAVAVAGYYINKRFNLGAANVISDVAQTASEQVVGG